MELKPVNRLLLVHVRREKEKTLDSGLIVPEVKPDQERAYEATVISVAADCNKIKGRTKIHPGDYIYYSPFTGATIPRDTSADEEFLLLPEDRVLAVKE